jgi:hypothetical protein
VRAIFFVMGVHLEDVCQIRVMGALATGAMGSAEGNTNPLIALRAHDELSGRHGKENSMNEGSKLGRKKRKKG